MDWNDLLQTALRATVVYFFMLFVVRLMGKRSVGTIGAFDLIVAMMISEVVDEAVYGDVALVKIFIVIGSVATWHILNAWAGTKSKFIDRLTEASPAVIVEDGRYLPDVMARERINRDEVESAMRVQSIEDISEVKRATIEPSGEISFLQQEWAKPIQKGDLPHPHQAR
jgi:uncharacterized membrane protein YcaP (DUF421 family)